MNTLPIFQSNSTTHDIHSVQDINKPTLENTSIQPGLAPHRSSVDFERKQNIAKQESAHPHRITEIILAQGLCDSIQMLLPMLSSLNQEQRWLAWIDPPTSLVRQWQQQRHSNSLDNIMLLRSKNTEDSFHLIQKALSAGTCHAVIAWTNQLNAQKMNTLELASRIGHSHGILLRYNK